MYSAHAMKEHIQVMQQMAAYDKKHPHDYNWGSPSHSSHRQTRL